MPVFGRYYRRRRRRGRLARLYSRRTKRGRRRIRTYRKKQRVKRRAKNLCPAVYQCLRHLGDTQHAYIKALSYNALQRSSADSFASDGGANNRATGPGSADCKEQGTATTDIGQGHIIGCPVYNWVPAATQNYTGFDHPSSIENPANLYWRDSAPSFQVFPMLAKTDPSLGATYNSSTCRTGEEAVLKTWSNVHTLKITFPNALPASGNIDSKYAFQALSGEYLEFIEMLFWVNDLSTIEDNQLCLDEDLTRSKDDWVTAFNTSRTWLLRQYNAYCTKRPNADADVSMAASAATNMTDFTDNFSITYKPDQEAVEIPGRELKEFVASGVYDRKKDARLIYCRKRRYRRNLRQLANWFDPTEDVYKLPLCYRNIKAGLSMRLNKKFTWQRGAGGDSTMRQVVPRGCYVYGQIFRYRNPHMTAQADPQFVAPTITRAFTAYQRPIKMSWQNI